MQSFYGSFSQAERASASTVRDDDHRMLTITGSTKMSEVSNGVVITKLPKQPNTKGLDGMSFESWLLAIDPTGGLQIYLQSLTESYDTVRQIVRTYSVSLGSPAETFALDPQIFEDLGVDRSDHQQLFRQWFLEACGVGNESGPIPEGLPDNGIQPNGYDIASGAEVYSSAPKTSIVAQSPGKGSSMSTSGDLHNLTFKDWLMRIDCSGSMASYCEVLQENYDTVAQIVKTYSLPSKGGPLFDVQFFEDVAVISQAHQSAFLEWFARECGVDVSHAMPDVQTHSLKRRDQHLQPIDQITEQGAQMQSEELRSFDTAEPSQSTAAEAPADVAAWLATHHLQQYAINLGDAGYDELAVFRMLRPNEIEEMLDAVQVIKPGHRVKFRRAVEALQAG